MSGGYDRGFEIHTVTISCEVCMEIMDLTIPRENWVKGVDAGLAKQPDPQVFCCKVCDNQTCPPWKSDCPKCGERLERVSLVMDWD